MLIEAIDRILQNKPIGDSPSEADAESFPEGEERLSELWAKLKQLQDMHNELQHFSIDLSKGELGTNPPPRNNYLASGLKQLQMHLRHLTWQAQCISQGDYNQKIDFMGEFSEAFNKMVDQLRDREYKIITQRETMLRVFDQVEPIFILADREDMQVLYANKLANLRFRLDDESQMKKDMLEQFRSRCKPEMSEQIQDMDSGRWYRVTCERFFWAQEQDSLLYHCVDITSHIKRESDLEQEAHTDKLTGLNNRHAFERAFDKLWELCRQNQSPLAVILFDIDHFKICNDTYGHLQGDKCLVAFANVMRANIGRFNDVIARFGGEEFIALLPFTNQEAAVRIAEAVRKEIENTQIQVETGDRGILNIQITVSGGVTSRIPDFEAIPDLLLEEADRALYVSKESGRNRISIVG